MTSTDLQNALACLSAARLALRLASKPLLAEAVDRLIEETEAEVKWDSDSDAAKQVASMLAADKARRGLAQPMTVDSVGKHPMAAQFVASHPMLKLAKHGGVQ